MYFATLLKTTAPVKLPISQFFLPIWSIRDPFFNFEVNIDPTLISRYSKYVYRLPYSLVIKVVLDQYVN